MALKIPNKKATGQLYTCGLIHKVGTLALKFAQQSCASEVQKGVNVLFSL